MSRLGRCILAAALVLLVAPAALADPTPARQGELMHRLLHDCGSCHGMTMKGGLAPALLPGTLAAKEDAYLVAVILDGVPGTPMPPWSFEIDSAEAAWLVARLRQGLGGD
jgi:cytochrome c55X